jgi:hypothetical protein
METDVTTYERTYTRPCYEELAEWQAGYRFIGKVTGGGVAEKFDPSRGPRVHDAYCVRVANKDEEILK